MSAVCLYFPRPLIFPLHSTCVARFSLFFYGRVAHARVPLGHSSHGTLEMLVLWSLFKTLEVMFDRGCYRVSILSRADRNASPMASVVFQLCLVHTRFFFLAFSSVGSDGRVLREGHGACVGDDSELRRLQLSGTHECVECFRRVS